MRNTDKAKFNIIGNVEIYSLPNNFTYSDYHNLSKEQKHEYLVEKGENLVVDVGMQYIIDLMIAVVSGSFTHCRVGSGSTTPASSDTALQTIIGSGLTVTNRYRSSLSGHWDTFFSTSDNNGTWNETALATASTGGTILCRRVLGTPFVKSSSNTAVVAWTITLAAVAD